MAGKKKEKKKAMADRIDFCREGETMTETNVSTHQPTTVA